MNDYPPIMTVREVTKYLNISTSQVYRYTERSFDPMPCVVLSVNTTRIVKAKLDEWIERQEKRETEDLKNDHLKEDSDQSQTQFATKN